MMNKKPADNAVNGPYGLMDCARSCAHLFSPSTLVTPVIRAEATTDGRTHCLARCAYAGIIYRRHRLAMIICTLEDGQTTDGLGTKTSSEPLCHT